MGIIIQKIYLASKKYWIFLITTFVWFLYRVMNIHSIAFYDADKNIILFRILHWCGIYFTLYIVKEFVAKWHEKEVQRRLCWSIIFGLLVGSMFLFVWPGTWS